MDMDIKMKFNSQNSSEKECCLLLQAAETSVCSFKCVQRIAQSPAQPWNDWGKTKGNLPAGPEEVARLDNYRPLKTESAYSGTGHWTGLRAVTLTIFTASVNLVQTGHLKHNRALSPQLLASSGLTCSWQDFK